MILLNSAISLWIFYLDYLSTHLKKWVAEVKPLLLHCILSYFRSNDTTKLHTTALSAHTLTIIMSSCSIDWLLCSDHML